MRARFPKLLPILLLFAVLGCGEDDPTEPEIVPTELSRTIEPTGGSLKVQNANKVQVQVSIPSGALLEPVEVSLAAVATPVGMVARFDLRPAGLQLLLPVEFEVTLPDGIAMDPSLGLVFELSERIAVPTELDLGARTLRATLYSLGFGELSKAEGDPFINVQEIACQFLRDSLTDAILRAQAFVGPFPPDLASPLIQQYKAALAVCESEGGVADATALVRQMACQKVTSASTNADVLQAETAADLKAQLGYLLAADALAQESGAECAVQSSSYDSTLNEFIQHYADRIQAPEFLANFPTWNALWNELRNVLQVAALADQLGLPERRAQVDNTLMPALFSRLHEVARQKCSEEEDNAFLADILTGGHLLGHALVATPDLPYFTGLEKPSLQREYQLCGTSIVVQTLDADDEVIDEVMLDEQNTSNVGPLSAPTDGRIRIVADDLMGTHCGDQIVHRPPVRARAEKPGSNDVVQLGQLGGPLTASMQSIASGLELSEGGSFHILIERFGTPCDMPAIGPASMQLFDISLNAAEPAARTATGTWTGNCDDEEGNTIPISGTFQITIDSDGDVSGSYDGDSDGSISGSVSGGGTLTAVAGGCSWVGSVNLSGPVITGSGNWTCSAECGGDWTITGGGS